MTTSLAHAPLKPRAGVEKSMKIRAETALEPESFLPIRRRALLDGCKWDAQVGDVMTLAPFPLVMTRRAWEQLACWSEQLAAEAVVRFGSGVPTRSCIH